MLRRGPCVAPRLAPPRPTIALRARSLSSAPKSPASPPPPSPSSAVHSGATPQSASAPATPPAEKTYHSRFARPIEYSQARKNAANPELIVRTQRMFGHFRNRQTARGEEVFQSLLNDGLEPDEHAWTTVLDGWAMNQRLDKVRATIELMKQRGVVVHLQAWGVLLKALIGVGRVQEAMELLERLEREGPRPDVVTYNLVLTHIARHVGQSQLAAAIFEKVGVAAEPDVISYRGYLHALAEDGKFDQIPRVLQQMRHANVAMGLATFTPLIKAAFRHKRTDLVEFYLSELQSVGPDLPLAAVLVNGYWKARDLKRLFPLLEQLRKEMKLDVELYTFIAEIYEATAQPEAVLELPQEMHEKELRPSHLNVDLGGIVIDAALKVRTPEQCAALLEELWGHGWPTPSASGLMVAQKLRAAGLGDRADALAKAVEHREYERLARKIRREVVHESQGRPLYLPKVRTKRIYWSGDGSGPPPPPASAAAKAPPRQGAQGGQRKGGVY